MKNFYQPLLPFTLRTFLTQKSAGLLLYLLLFTFYLLLFTFSFSQTNPCTPNTPVYYVDLTGNPGGTWVSSPPIVRDGSCCGSEWPDRCVVFLITLDTGTIAINFNIASGAVPPGAMYYQIDCSSPTQVGQPICLQGPGPYALTFCKPGSNLNTYSITAIAAPSGPADDTVGIGCNTSLSVSGLNPSSVTWTSVFPGGQGAFNNYLSCTAGCTTTVVTPQPGAPSFVDYKVCGQSLAPSCLPDPSFCDTVRVYFNPALTASVSPDPAVYCASLGGITLTANVSGGDGTYFYQWTNSSGTFLGNSSTYFATTQGTYIFQVYDGQYPGCPAKYDTVVVTQQAVPVVSAGADQSICSGGSIALSGTMSGATGITWSGGNGFYNPNNTSLNITYTPTSNEIAAGSATLTLSSTGNGACPPATDQVIIFIKPTLTATISGSSIVCFGANTQLTANVTGGTAPYSFVWNTGATSQSIIAAPGNYSVTVTDMSSGMCTSVTTFSVLQDPQVSVSVSPNSSINCSVTTAISATPSGGTGSFSYLWNTGQTSQTVIVYPGIYTVIVTDGVGCSATGTVNVSGINSTLAASIQQPPNLCFGGTKNITVAPSGGFGGYNYQWSTGQTSQTINVSAGTYCCTVTDAGGCITTACVTINQNSPLSVSITNPSPVCNGAMDTIFAVPNGGQSPYTYLWSTGQTSQGIIQSAGTYSVTVTDANQNGGCTASSTAVVFNEPNFTISLTSNNVSCSGGNNGNATVFASGGVPGYTYQWSPSGGNTTTANNLTAGNYTVIVVDNIGCLETGTVTVTEPIVLFSSISITSNVNCSGGSNGVTTVSVSGGTTPYSYQWSPFGGTGTTATGLTAGTYIVSISDAQGCTNSSSATVTQPTILSAIISGTNVSCNSGNNGSATVSPSGGTSPYFYNWSNGGNTATISNLSPGNYSVTVTDNKNCTVIKTVNIAQPSTLNASISSSTNVSCNGEGNGAAAASANGGTSPYIYSWSTGISSQSVSNLSPGNYIVTVSDVNGCTATNNVNITQPAVLLASASPDQSITCNTTVTLSSTPSGGTSAYSYQWSNGATTQNITSNTPGIYVVTVTDANNCTAIDSVVVTSSNSTLNATISAPNFICNGSTTLITANPSGGAGNYSYLWSTGQITSSINAGAGIYCVTITDNNGCKITACINIQNEAAFSVAVSPNATCFGSPQTLTANVTGGINPYTFLWSTGETTQSVLKNAGTYSVTVSDSIFCTAAITVNITEAELLQVGFTNVSNVTCKGDDNGAATANPTGGVSSVYTYQWSPVFSTNASVYNLTPGTYSVTVTDAIGCTGTNSVTITEPNALLSIDSIDGNNIFCYGGTNGFGTVSASGGNSPFNYLWWYDGDTVVTNTNLPAGYYSISVADTGGCTATETMYLSQPPFLTMNTGVIAHVSCNGGANGSAVAQVSGGKTPYTYQWSNGGTTTTITGLTAGFYTVTVTDANGCIVQSQSPVQIAQPAAISVDTVITNAKCVSATGEIIANASGGTAPYTYNWSNGDTTAIISNIPAGTYNITVTDNSNCIQSQQVIVGTNQPNITVFSSKTNTICTSSTGIAVINNVSGGTSPYSYFWSNGSTNDTITNLPANTYYVTITDSTGCVKTDSVIIVTTQPEINVSVNQTSAICASATGSAFINNISGGNSPYSFLWSNGANNDTISNISAGTYGVTVTDSLGCDTSKMITISATQSTVSITVYNIINVSCYGGNDGFISLNNASGGAPPYTYTWISPADTGKVIDSLPAGNYTISVVDTNSCSFESTFTITQPNAITITSNARNVSCKGSSDGLISLNVSGGTSPYMFNWSPNVSTSDSASLLDTGIYFITITDANNCTSAISDTIAAPVQILTADVSSNTNVTCFGGTDGTATASGTGGTSPYTFLWSNSVQTQNIASLTSDIYSVTITDAGGCTSTDSVFISEPNEIITTLSGNTSVCTGKSTLLTASANGGTSPYTFNWLGLGTSASQLITPDSNITYIIIVSDANGCSDTFKVDIIVNPPIVPQILPFDTIVICSGESASVGAAATGGTGGGIPSNYTYSWSPQIGTGNGPFTVSPLVTTTYTVEIWDSCSEKVSVKITVVVNPTPTASPIWLPDTGCAPLTIEFSTPSNNPPGTNYLWDFDDGTTSIYATYSHTYTQPGTYVPTITVSLGNCDTTFYYSTNVVQVYPTPIAEFTADPQPTTLAFPTITFQNVSQGGTTYFWNFGDGTTSTDGAAEINHTFKDTGTYTVTLITTNQIPCPDTFTMEITILPEFQFWVPNAFTPEDKNGKNDYFLGKGICIADYEMYIFDRWGDEIFHTIDINKGWDGKAHRGKKQVQIGVYVYLIYINDCLGEKHRYLGYVTVVR